MIKIKGYEDDVEKMFDSYCKRSLKNKLKDYKRHEAWRRKHELSLSFLSENELSILEDDMFVEIVVFEGEECTVRDSGLKEALKNLSEEKFNIIMFYYFFGMTDKEISNKLKQKRTAIRNKRYHALYILREFLGGTE